MWVFRSRRQRIQMLGVQRMRRRAHDQPVAFFCTRLAKMDGAKVFVVGGVEESGSCGWPPTQERRSRRWVGRECRQSALRDRSSPIDTPKSGKLEQYLLRWSPPWRKSARRGLRLRRWRVVPPRQREPVRRTPSLVWGYFWYRNAFNFILFHLQLQPSKLADSAYTNAKNATNNDIWAGVGRWAMLRRVLQFFILNSSFKCI